jgi:hypothetical protein
LMSVQKDTTVSGKCLSSNNNHWSPPRSSLWELYPPEQRDGVQGESVSFRVVCLSFTSVTDRLTAGDRRFRVQVWV